MHTHTYINTYINRESEGEFIPAFLERGKIFDPESKSRSVVIYIGRTMFVSTYHFAISGGSVERKQEVYPMYMLGREI